MWEERVARARIDIDMTRLLCLKAADMMDKVGNKSAKQEIAMIKVQAPNMALKIIDDAIQAHGGGGVSNDYGLAKAYAHQRTLRLADGPDEVHARSIARMEFAKHADEGPARTACATARAPLVATGRARATWERHADGKGCDTESSRASSRSARSNSPIRCRMKC